MFVYGTPCHDQGPESAISAVVWVVREEKLKSERNSKTILKMHDHELSGVWPGSAVVVYVTIFLLFLLFIQTFHRPHISLLHTQQLSSSSLPSVLFIHVFRTHLMFCCFFSGASRMMSYYCNVCEDLRRETASVAWLYDPQTILFSAELAIVNSSPSVPSI